MKIYCPICKSEMNIVKNSNNDSEIAICSRCCIILDLDVVKKFSENYICISPDILDKKVLKNLGKKMFFTAMIDLETGKEILCLTYNHRDIKAKAKYVQVYLQVKSKVEKKKLIVPTCIYGR